MESGSIEVEEKNQYIGKKETKMETHENNGNKPWTLNSCGLFDDLQNGKV